MQPLKTNAIVLRRTNYGEADRILQVITPENGKIGIMAKGVRREKSKLASGIELFSLSELVVVRGRSDLGVLTSARLIKFYSSILSDYERLQFGYAVLKRVNQIAEHLHKSSLYNIAANAFKSLDNPDVDLRLTQAWFYLQIAEILGHGLNLSRDDANQTLSSEKTYRFDIAEMSFTEHIRGTFGSEHLKLLKIMKLKTPDVVGRISGTEKYINDCLSLARAVGE